MLNKIKQTVNFLTSRLIPPSDIGIITGTGLGSIIEQVSADVEIPYLEIPNFPKATVDSHSGMLVAGKTGTRSIIAMGGRFHLYEGYTPQEITFPVRVMAAMGVKYLFISSAAGGLNPSFTTGDLMLVTDHINLTGANPLIGPNLDTFGPRFPDMSETYDPELIRLAESKALKEGISLKKGVYLGLAGPSLETRSETRFLRIIGADAVGMSTVLEVIAGAHCGMKIIAIVAITNMNLPDQMEKSSIDAIIKAAQKAGPDLSRLWKNIMIDL
jgi:purine-nucleoside phosphorylase